LTAEDSASPIDSFPLSGMTPIKRVVLFAATSWEIEAVRAAFGTETRQDVDGTAVLVCKEGTREYWLTKTGIGPEKASRTARKLLMRQPFTLAVSTGFACALVSTEIGALLLGREVIAMEKGDAGRLSVTEIPEDEGDTMIRFAQVSGQANHVGRFVSTNRIVGSATDKRRFARLTGAVGLDMESAALAEEARRARVPFVIVRTVSDLLDEDLPLDFNLFLQPAGWLKGMASVAGHPSRLAGLWRLRRQSRTAAGNLTAFFRRYVGTVAGRFEA
jgi:adenosylhomocysteine nucleosidase